MSAFRTHGRGHLNGPVVVVGTGLLGTSIGLGLRGRGVAVFLSDPSPTNQAVAVDIGAGLPLARLDGEQPELVVVAAPPDVTADVVAARPRATTRRPPSWTSPASRPASRPSSAPAAPTSAATWAPTRWPAGKSRVPSPPAASSSPRCRGSCARRRRPCRRPCRPHARWPATSAPSSPNSEPRNTTRRWRSSRTCPRWCPRSWPAGCRARPCTRCPSPATDCGTSPGSRRATRRCGCRSSAPTPTRWWRSCTASARTCNRLIGTLEDPTAPGARLDLAQLISEGNAGQSRIPGKHGGPPQAYSWLTVLVDDTPGQIARLLTEIGEIGVNLEDLRLDHSSGQNVGMVEISVLPNKHELLIEALNDRGWRVLQ